MNLHLLRVVLRSGSLTELIFDKASDALKAHDALADGTHASDDYGHTMSVTKEEVAGLILVDLAAELKGHMLLTFERQMSQDRLGERVQKARDLSPPVIQMRPANGSTLITR